MLSDLSNFVANFLPSMPVAVLEIGQWLMKLCYKFHGLHFG